MRSAKAAFWGLAIACLGTTAELSAQIPTDRTYLEFAIPARIPGATLAPGMYLFVIGSPVGGQSIIDIYSSDGSRLIATCLAIESAMPRPAQSTIVDYPGVTPAPLRAWFHPANVFGLEFVYSQTEAREIFTATKLAVPYAPFKPSNRDLIGAFPIGRLTPVPIVGVSGAASFAPAPAGTSGVTALVETFDESLGPHQHLTTARRLLAARAPAAPDHERVVLDILSKQMDRLQAAYRRNDRKEMQEARRVIDTSILNLLPNESEIAQHRQHRLSRDTLVVLERVLAHLRAALDL